MALWRMADGEKAATRGIIEALQKRVKIITWRVFIVGWLSLVEEGWSPMCVGIVDRQTQKK